MAKITKNSELFETSSKTSLCEDPREAWIEIASWKYDSHFLKLARIYFAEEYQNTNKLELDGAKIRTMFLENFDFRKSLIEFWQKKWLWSENAQVRNAMTHKMNFEWEDIAKIKEGYTNQIKEMFFKEKKIEGGEITEVDDPILLLLKESDQKKVVLSKKYGWDMKTFTKLFTVLSLADAQQQEDITDYLVAEDLQKSISPKERTEIIDVAGENAIDEVFRRSIRLQGNQYDSKSGKKRMEQYIISHIISEDFTKNISPKIVYMIIDKIKDLVHFGRSEVTIKRLDCIKFVEKFLEWIEVTQSPVDEEMMEAVKKCLYFIWKHYRSDDFCLKNQKIDFSIIRESISIETMYFAEMLQWIGICKGSVEKNASEKIHI